MLPEESSAIPFGILNHAWLPAPSCWPAMVGKPASVLTAPLELIFRIVLLPASAT